MLGIIGLFASELTVSSSCCVLFLNGNKLLTSGLWAYARKINYTADWIQSLMWGISAGFLTPITFFYPVFFLAVLTHRNGRDFEKCARKYGDDWEEYCKVVKYKYIPGVY